MSMAVHYMAVHKWTQHKGNQSRGYPLDYPTFPLPCITLKCSSGFYNYPFCISYCWRGVVFLFSFIFLFFFFHFNSLFLMVRDWLGAFSSLWVRLLRKLCGAGWPECWLHHCMGPRVTQEASLAGKKLFLNRDDWKIGLIAMSPEQDNANREHELHTHFWGHSKQLLIAQ